MVFIRKVIACVVIAAAVFALSSCSQEQEASSAVRISEAEDDTFKIFRTDDTKSALLYESSKEPDINMIHIDMVKEVLRKLESTPVNEEMKRLLPENVTMDSVYFGQDGQLVINFSKSYNSLDTVTELLLRSGYVKTLCQFDFVDYVEFYVDDSPLILRGDSVPGLMRGSDFIDSTGRASYFSQEIELTLYFAKRAGKLLGSTVYNFEYDGRTSYESLVAEQLVRGPQSSDTQLLATLPEGTVINKITTSDGIVYVDLSEEFLNYRENIGEELTIYSLVNSLCEIHGITKVQITVNGTGRKSIDKYGQSGLLERRPDLILNEKAGEADG